MRVNGKRTLSWNCNRLLLSRTHIASIGSKSDQVGFVWNIIIFKLQPWSDCQRFEVVFHLSMAAGCQTDLALYHPSSYRSDAIGPFASTSSFIEGSMSCSCILSVIFPVVQPNYKDRRFFREYLNAFWRVTVRIIRTIFGKACPWRCCYLGVFFFLISRFGKSRKCGGLFQQITPRSWSASFIVLNKCSYCASLVFPTATKIYPFPFNVQPTQPTPPMYSGKTASE